MGLLAHLPLPCGALVTASAVPSQHDDSRLLPNRKRSRNSKPSLLPTLLQEAKPLTTGGCLVSFWRRQEVGDLETLLSTDL